MSTKHNNFGNRTTNTHLLPELQRQIRLFLEHCLSFGSRVPDGFIACKPHVRYPESVLCHTKIGSKVVGERGRIYRKYREV